MWPLLTILAAGAACAVHFWWRRRFRELERRIDDQTRESDRLRDLHQLAIEDVDTQREALFNSMAEGFMLVDREARVQSINQALLRFFEIEADVRGKSLIEAFRNHELLEVWQQVQREGQV